MKKIVIFIMVIAAITACKNTGTKQESSDPMENTKLQEFSKKAEGVVMTPGKPSDVATLLELSGARFMPQILHDPALAAQYKVDPVWAAANMGVYLADAIYQFAYDSISGAYQSAIAAKALAEEIGIESDAFMGFIKDRYSEVDEDKDSLYTRIDRAMVEAGTDLTGDERFRLLAAMYIGNYIEKQYQVLSIIYEYPVDVPEETKLLLLREMILVLGHQADAIDYVIELIEAAETEDDPGFLSYKLKGYKEDYDALSFTEEEIAFMTAPMIFENEKILSMYSKVKDMRDYIITVQ